jgi:hypothetical protein
MAYNSPNELRDVTASARDEADGSRCIAQSSHYRGRVFSAGSCSLQIDESHLKRNWGSPQDTAWLDGVESLGMVGNAIGDFFVRRSIPGASSNSREKRPMQSLRLRVADAQIWETIEMM